MSALRENPGKSSLHFWILDAASSLGCEEKNSIWLWISAEKSSCANNKIDLSQLRAKREQQTFVCRLFPFSRENFSQSWYKDSDGMESWVNFSSETSIAMAALSNGGKWKRLQYQIHFEKLLLVQSAVNSTKIPGKTKKDPTFSKLRLLLITKVVKVKCEKIVSSNLSRTLLIVLVGQ